MSQNRFSRSFTAALLLTGFILLVLSVGPQVGAFSEGNTDTGLFPSGPRSVGSSLSAPGQNIDMNAAFLARGRDALAGQYAAPQNVLGPRLNEALPAIGASDSSQLIKSYAGFGDLQAFSASRAETQLSQEALDAWAARYQAQAKELGAAGAQQALDAWTARLQGQADELGVAGGQQALDDWAAAVSNAYYLGE